MLLYRNTQPVWVHSGREASRAQGLKALTGKLILHFSCHGHSDLQTPLRSALLMANAEPLTLQDFLNTRLHTQLAVLSACETGLPGTHLPDEVVSLAAGLLQAGVASIVSSLWSIMDISTFLLMLRFYQRLADNAPTASLRQAQQWLRDSTHQQILAFVQQQVDAGILDVAVYQQVRRSIAFKPLYECGFVHPFYWAAFTVVGV